MLRLKKSWRECTDHGDINAWREAPQSWTEIDTSLWQLYLFILSTLVWQSLPKNICMRRTIELTGVSLWTYLRHHHVLNLLCKMHGPGRIGFYIKLNLTIRSGPFPKMKNSYKRPRPLNCQKILTHQSVNWQSVLSLSSELWLNNGKENGGSKYCPTSAQVPSFVLLNCTRQRIVFSDFEPSN